MATSIYKIKTVYLFDGTEIEISPLKIKYLKEFMDTFPLIKETKTDDEALLVMLECVRICMKQFYPELKTVEQIEDNLDMETLKSILENSAGIKFDQDPEEGPKKETTQEPDSGWESLDLAKLEAEVFILGNWKNFDELEQSLSMVELTEIISSKRDLDYQEKKFLAAIQGVELEGDESPQKKWEDMKARVFSKGKATDSNDILALQGENARKAGFGIGLGLEYEDLR